MKNLILILLITSFSAYSAVIPDSFRVDFDQVHQSLTKKRKTATGVKLDYKYPSQIVYETSGVNKTKYVSNGKKSWYYTSPFMPEEQGEVIVQSKVDMGLLRFFDSLKKGLKKNKYFTYTYNARKLTFDFTQKGMTDFSLDSIVFHVKKSKKLDDLSLNDFEKIVLNKTNKKSTELSIKKVEENKKFSSRHFYFKAPKNTKVVQR